MKKETIRKILWIVTIIYGVYFVLAQITVIGVGGGIALVPLLFNNVIFLMWGLYWFIFVRKKKQPSNS